MITREAVKAASRRADSEGNRATLEAYLEALMTGFDTSTAAGGQPGCGLETTSEMVLDLLTSRDFCYLSKMRVSVYRQGILERVRKALCRAEPIPFYYDLGGGYHASTRPGESALYFEPGLAELFVLSQISSFAARVRCVYPLGVKFSLVIDNLCALLINEISVAKTLDYCEKLRQLIREVGMHGVVDVLVESEHFSVQDFEPLRQEARASRGADRLTRQQHANVERFLGRRCDGMEALERALRYQEVVEASERLLAPLIIGVHMTQRATAATICFRPFPGGDSRIQSGEVALVKNGNGKLHPLLLTTNNIDRYTCRRYGFPDLLPSVIPHVTYAEQARG